ncbi:MAG: DNA polymerase III subunit epsilon [Betaproteobacteria bacterium]|jgi:DNA polymerase-3 subunit epsilon
MRQIFLDTETTGLDALAGDRIVEIGCIEMVGRRLTGRHLHLYFNPQRPVHPEAMRVHGLTDDFLADKPRFSEGAPQVLEFVQGAELIIHNAAFDTGFLNEEFKRLGQPRVQTLAAKVTDSLAMAREMFPGKSNSLDALCRRLEVDNSNRAFHGALLDAGLLAEVYVRMTRGQDSLVIDSGSSTQNQRSDVNRLDLSQIALPVTQAGEAELQAHEQWLKDLDKASGGKTVWRTFGA